MAETLGAFHSWGTDYGVDRFEYAVPATVKLPSMPPSLEAEMPRNATSTCRYYSPPFSSFDTQLLKEDTMGL